MPPVYLHMATARDIGLDLAGGLLQRNRGIFYFGSTTPDIRVLTRGDRGDTHYFDLNNFDHQDSVEAFFKAQRHLAAPEGLDEDEVAFVAGYLTHLVLDETYIVSVYRPYFGQLSAMGGSLQANMMDRLLQYELERRRRAAPAERDDIRDALRASSIEFDVGFLDTDTLRRWQEVAIDITRHPPTWERFKLQGGRHLRQEWMEDPERYEEFLQTIPELLQRTLQHVSTAQVDAFVERSKERARRVVERYLGCG